eukprot:TRINITY_DN3539_c0_g1_i1.p1 TRINITY_DN3539_c0_g1~~TRINITY_DN3539_c0_g1_i1.p1  ORF type:complete len:153 (-),score=18.24 TRINITY_DN3539_c0_g1_i1:35-454(-)
MGDGNEVSLRFLVYNLAVWPEPPRKTELSLKRKATLYELFDTVGRVWNYPFPRFMLKSGTKVISGAELDSELRCQRATDHLAFSRRGKNLLYLLRSPDFGGDPEFFNPPEHPILNTLSTPKYNPKPKKKKKKTDRHRPT